jgi:hypothetical protein
MEPKYNWRIGLGGFLIGIILLVILIIILDIDDKNIEQHKVEKYECIDGYKYYKFGDMWEPAIERAGIVRCVSELDLELIKKKKQKELEALK